jgi:hypothetical protein
LIDWDKVMNVDRYAGGHIEVMEAIFGDRAQIIARYVEEDYQGTEAFAYEFPDGTIAIITDYFGSCSGCDAWEGAADEEARNMIRSLAIDARLFPNRQEAREFCETGCKTAEQWCMQAAENLVPFLCDNKE